MTIWRGTNPCPRNGPGDGRRRPLLRASALDNSPRDHPFLTGGQPLGLPPGVRRPAGVRAVTMTRPITGSGPDAPRKGGPAKPCPCDLWEVGHGPTTSTGAAERTCGQRLNYPGPLPGSQLLSCGRLPLPPVRSARRVLVVRTGAWGAGIRRPQHTRAVPGWHPRDRIQAPELEAPVVPSLTDAEQAELARKAAEVNKRSQDSVRARGGR